MQYEFGCDHSHFPFTTTNDTGKCGFHFLVWPFLTQMHRDFHSQRRSDFEYCWQNDYTAQSRLTHRLSALNYAPAKMSNNTHLWNDSKFPMAVNGVREWSAFHILALFLPRAVATHRHCSHSFTPLWMPAAAFEFACAFSCPTRNRPYKNYLCMVYLIPLVTSALWLQPLSFYKLTIGVLRTHAPTAMWQSPI